MATYKRVVFSHEKKKVPYLFENGLEKDYLDVLAEKSGLWRLGTTKANVYHMGDSIIDEKITDKRCEITSKDYPLMSKERSLLFWNSKFIEVMAKIVTRTLKKKVKRSV